MERHGELVRACMSAVALVCEAGRLLDFWETGAAEIYEQRQVIEQVIDSAPAWILDRAAELINSGAVMVKQCFNNLLTLFYRNEG